MKYSYTLIFCWKVGEFFTASITRCIKVEIIPVLKKENKEVNLKEFRYIINKELWDIQNKTRLACNYAMNLQFNELMRKETEKKEFGSYKKDKELYGKTFEAWLENRMNEYMDGVLSNNVASTRQFVTSKTNFDPVKILKGERTLATFKQDIPIFIHNKKFRIYINGNNDYEVEIRLFNLKKKKELGIGYVCFKLIKPDGNLKSTLNKLISKEYKQGSAQITYNKRKKKWLLTISFNFEPKVKVLDEHKILGVDLGIVNTATMSVYDEVKEQYEKMKWKERVINGTELIKYRQMLETIKISKSSATKWSSANKVGHGYKQRMSDANKSADKYERFRETYNHKISRYIVELAEKYDCGIIQMENLSGFSDHQSESLLKNWSYYDLQSKVKYKAEEKGIKVILINPSYTSQRCSNCGCIDGNNRNCKEKQDRFECVNCGFKENADINASKNIAIPDIDNIISQQLYIQQKQ